MKNQPHDSDALKETGFLDTSIEFLIQNDPVWVQKLTNLVQNDQKNQPLDPRLVTLIRLCIDVTATHLYAEGVKQHVQAALKLEVTQAEIVEVFKLASIVGIHSCALGIPILVKELSLTRIPESQAKKTSTPVCDEMRKNGSFNPAWETLYLWDPVYLENFLNMATDVWRRGILPPLWIELLCIAGDANITHLWKPGIQRHIKAALALGATKAQILEVFKIVSLQGLETFEVGVSLLQEVLKEYPAAL
ncbi:MAG TPA: gamma-carboxymuconolactone decarboxylase [Acinetobacter lwoffii]|uniref:Gamma-carboxymuconolactone decarboxylase n=1 Tax=Acinetobacter lwoffii TaxID=28090 RepID=A0A9D2USP4_ACILW|nr:gamma-carboxymuconolactone decarboxylase [Acinetobacter lwoffii]